MELIPILQRKPRRLKRLQIREVSSVDRGTGEDCGVVLMKRDDVASVAAGNGR
ncbi:MAG TPA: hypothetical protein VGY14_03120 [Methyloceanibacter sp.]|jgi:hypothetical protein|nr:hypothetical protein [Methyloceanibacter sp.]